MSILLGLLSIVISLVSYSFYIRDVLVGKTRPHVVTWLIWGFLNAAIFYQQVTHGADAGSWVTLVASIANFLIFALSLRHGEHRMTRLDVGCLALAAGALMLWWLDSDSSAAVVIAVSVFVIALVPTWRKSLANPYEETALTYALNSLKFLLAIFALGTISFTTAFYPFALFVTNGVFVLFLLIRRRSAGADTH